MLFFFVVIAHTVFAVEFIVDKILGFGNKRINLYLWQFRLVNPINLAVVLKIVFAAFENEARCFGVNNIKIAKPLLAVCCKRILELRSKYDLRMKVERYVSDENGIPETDMQFINE